MTVRVRASDGSIVNFPDDTPEEEMARAMRQLDQEIDARRAANPDSYKDLTHRAARTTPTPYQRGYRERAMQRVPRGRPGSFERGLEDFNRNGPAGLMSQMWRNVGIADDVAEIGARLRGASEEEARGAGDYERNEQQRVAREQPRLNTASIVASIPALGGNPTTALSRIPAWRAGAAASATNAPFALARQEGDLGERLPGAAFETGAVFAGGTALQGLANRLARAPRPNTGRARAQQFADAGVRPTQAAVSGGAPAGLTKMVSENFLAGAPARARLQASLDDTAAASRRLAGEYGQHGQPEQVGEAVQRGVQRFSRETPPAPRAGRPETISTREWSFRAKANALYDDVFRLITGDETAHLAGQTGATASADATRRVLAEMQSRVQAPNLAEIVQNPTLGRVAQALEADQGAIRFNDLRALRTWVREQRSAPVLTQSIDNASLARLESALTEDIYTSAIEIGGEVAAQRLRRVDQFYRAGARRIESALQPFADQTGRGAYQRIVALAREGGRQNTRALQSLRNSLRPDEWREVAATVIDDLGRPTAGNPGVLEPGAFSVEQFVTNYAKLSPDGRRILFGGNGTEGLAAALDNLAQVAGYQKGVERMVNASRSGVNAQNFGSFVGLVNPGTMAPTAGLLAGMALTGEMLTNPAFVRWLASVSRSGAGVQGMRRQLAGLATIAARDPAIAPLHAELAQRVGEQFQREERPRRAPGAPPQRQPELMP